MNRTWPQIETRGRRVGTTPGLTRLGFVVAIPVLGAVLVLASLLHLPARAGQDAGACSSFSSRVWAQTIFDDDPSGNAALDPDRDGLACETLPLGAAPALWTDSVPPTAEPVDLGSVTDGDTIDIFRDGRLESVRLVGVDAPEASGPYQNLECYGLESGDFLQWLLGQGGQLYLEQDQEDRDRFGRLLRWVWLERDDGVYLVNEAVIRAGHAARFRDTPNRRYVDELTDAEAFARRYGAGLWSACEGFPLLLGMDSVPALPPVLPRPDPATGCDPSYPDVCIPPPPPDLSCRDIPHTRFRVLPPDPHQFDGNRDGIACEGPG